MKNQILVGKLLAIASILSCLAPVSVLAGPVQDTINTVGPSARQAQYQWWNSLTPRQQYLERALSRETYAYYQRTGQGVYPSQQNLSVLMNRIGARPQEAQWIAQRLSYHYNVANQMNRADRTINHFQGVLNCLNRGGGLGCWR